MIQGVMDLVAIMVTRRPRDPCNSPMQVYAGMHSVHTAVVK